jgi:predicted amidohydrolase YtcJ
MPISQIISVMLTCGLVGVCSLNPASPPAADLVLRNGKIATVDDAHPAAQALAIRGETIAAVGTEEEILPYIGSSTRVVDLHGMLAIPGFVESHAHFRGIGAAKMQLDLMPAKSWEEIVSAVQAAVRKAKPGEWIIGRGWHQEKWITKPEPNVEGFPLHASLSLVSPDNPVLLTHASGHAVFANSRAMKLAGVTTATPNPPGGEIVRDRTGNPIGVFRETASGLLERAHSAALSRRTPEQVKENDRREVELAIRECLAKGITTFHDAGASFSTVDLYREFADQAKLGLRLYVMLSEENPALAGRLNNYRMIGYGGGHLTVRAIKRYMDGALGSRGAWLLEPYRDLPGSTGLNTTPVSEIADTARLAFEHGFQLCVHAIGDRANRETLDIFEKVVRDHPESDNLRWRIEHAQHLNGSDVARFGALGVIAAMQGIHCTSDAPYVLARLGPARAAEGAYVWRKILKSGGVVCNGTDAPVEDVDPIACYFATATRKLADGSTFYPDQRMTRAEALRSYTLSGAYAGFEEKIKGSLAPGKLADIAVLSRDILTVPDDDIRGARVTCTIVGGKILYTAGTN